MTAHSRMNAYTLDLDVDLTNIFYNVTPGEKAFGPKNSLFAYRAAYLFVVILFFWAMENCGKLKCLSPQAGRLPMLGPLPMRKCKNAHINQQSQNRENEDGSKNQDLICSPAHLPDRLPHIALLLFWYHFQQPAGMIRRSRGNTCLAQSFKPLQPCLVAGLWLLRLFSLAALIFE